MDADDSSMEDSTAAQADESVPPWKQPGGFRMDCEPHRGELLKAAASFGVVLAFVSICPLACLGAALALPLTLAVWVVADADLERMRKGVINPEGAGLTEGAKRLSLAAFVAAAVVAFFWVFIVALLAILG